MSENDPDLGRRGLPHLTYDYLETLISNEGYHHFPNTGVTVCCLSVKNGYSVTESVVCANQAAFNEAVGTRRARRKAMEVLMGLEYYLLRQRLYELRLNTQEHDDGTGH